MKTELIINKFKRINKQIAFSEFNYVNYFVGENGSGKTSILNAISYLNDGGNSRHFFGNESIVNFTVDGRSQFLFWNTDNPNKTENRGDLPLGIHLIISNIENEKGRNNLRGDSKISATIGVGNAESLEKFNGFLEETGNPKVTAKKSVDQTDPFNQDNGRLIFESELGTINPEFIADGLRAKHNFKKNLTEWIKNIDNTETVYVFIIEEPENNLHPNFQKEIPGILNSIYESTKPEFSKRILFFISTHSPFIIGAAAKYSNQKVYPLQNGKPLSINFADHTWEEVNNSVGYQGSECAYIVSKMLGADISDIGYPENYAVLEEYSLQLILDAARNKGIIKNFQFVSASGVSKAADLSETIYELEKLNTLIKCNPYYFDKYFMIVDSILNIDDTNLKKRVQKIGNRLGDRFIQLQLDTLEDYYVNIAKEIMEQAKKEIRESQESNKGSIKAKYAELISKKINSKDTFSQLFNGELDFLL
jgi:predicted ATPase